MQSGSLYPKNDTHPSLIIKHFIWLKNSFANHHIVYKNASKSSEIKAVGVVIITAIFSGEIYAISKALQQAQNQYQSKNAFAKEWKV